MDRMKTFLKYALWIIGFFIFSNILINLVLDSNYRDIKRLDQVQQVEIQQAQATKVNGRINGIIKRNDEPLEGKYVRIEFFSKRNVYLGQKYIDVSNLQLNQSQEINLYFKLREVDSYKVSFTNERVQENTEIEILPTDMSKQEIFVLCILSYMILF